MYNIVNPTSVYKTLQKSGVKLARASMSMGVVEPTQGQYSSGWLADYNTWISQLKSVGVKPVIDVVGAAPWATGSQDPFQVPSDPGAYSAFVSDYASFLSTVASRYAGRVAAWEIWNEEDEAAFWTGGGNAAQYTQLLKAAYSAVKAADPSATVVMGGLTGNDYNFLSQVYADGGAGSFDAVGVHTDTACDVVSPYDILRDPNGLIDPDSFLGYREVHAVMAAHGDANKPIWMTELGWSTTSALCDTGVFEGQKQGGVPPAVQATYLSQALHCLTQDSSIVPVGIVYDLEDQGGGAASRANFGLETTEGTPKPAFGALTDFNHLGDQITGSCGNTAGPAITIAAPKPSGAYQKELAISVSATITDAARTASQDPTLGVERITLYYDGKHKIRNFTNSAHPTTLTGQMLWDGAKKLSAAKHTLTVVATDSAGNATSTTVTVMHTNQPEASVREASRRARG
jgi:hypothetical protein